MSRLIIEVQVKPEVIVSKAKLFAHWRFCHRLCMTAWMTRQASMRLSICSG